jgi:hypothetical protein
MRVPGFTADACLPVHDASKVYRVFVASGGSQTNAVEPAGELCSPCHCGFRCYGSGLLQHCLLSCYKRCLYCEDRGGGNIHCEYSWKACRPLIFG